MRVLHFFKTYWPDTFGGVKYHATRDGKSALVTSLHSAAPMDRTLIHSGGGAKLQITWTRGLELEGLAD